MTILTEKELSAISDQLSAESLLIQKYKDYAQQTNDLQIKNSCEQIAAKHQKHYDTLFSFLN